VSLIEDLRRRINDTRRSYLGLTLSIDDTEATSVIAEVTQWYRLVITVSGGTAPSIDVDLNQSRYNTIGALEQELRKLPGYLVNLSPDVSSSHSTLDVEPCGPLQIYGSSNGLLLSVHLFSDFDLLQIVRDACLKHNPTFTPETIPDTEAALVLDLAFVEVCRRQAYDSTKRRGLSSTSTELLDLAFAIESSYAESIRRLRKALHTQKEAPNNEQGDGDITTGSLFRYSNRFGTSTRVGLNQPPSVPVIHEEATGDVEDTNIRIQWQRNSDVDFFSYELWIDTTESVVRIADRSHTEIRQLTQADRTTTSKMVFRATRTQTYPQTLVQDYICYVQDSGQLVTSFCVGELEPNTEYFFRLFVLDSLNEQSASDIISRKTLSRRTVIKSIDKTRVNAGDVVTVTTEADTPAAGTTHKLTVGGLPAALTVVDATHFTFVVPAFVNKRLLKDVCLISPNGLKSLAQTSLSLA
jgi:hypothetical protein